MKTKKKKGKNDAVRMELKYCEHCGSLWLRESGAGNVYCETCQPKVAQLPPPKKYPGKIALPLAKRALVDQFEIESEELLEMDLEELDFEAAGGVA